MRSRTTSAEVLVSAALIRAAAFETLGKRDVTVDEIARLRAEYEAFRAKPLDATSTAAFGAYVCLLRVAERLIAWRLGIRNADPASSVNLQSAKLLAADFTRAEVQEDSHTARLYKILDDVEELSEPSQVGVIVQRIRSVSLPIPLRDDSPKFPIAGGSADRERKDSSVALHTAFSIDGRPVSEPHYIESQVLHSLDLHVSISDWPPGAESLVLTPASAEPPTRYEFPDYEIKRPVGYKGGETEDSQTARVLLKYPVADLSEPIEFVYSAFFRGSSERIVHSGQRRLWFDNSAGRRTGRPEIDVRLKEVNNEIRFAPNVTPEVRRDLQTILGPLCVVASRSFNEKLFDDVQDENGFQARLTAQLNAWPEVAGELETHAQYGRGTTDLTFRQIPIELKIDRSAVDRSSIQKFVAQAAQYATATARGVSVLVDLDLTKMDTAPYSIANDIFVQQRKPDEKGFPHFVVCIVVRSNLLRPSDHSR